MAGKRTTKAMLVARVVELEQSLDDKLATVRRLSGDITSQLQITSALRRELADSHEENRLLSEACETRRKEVRDLRTLGEAFVQMSAGRVAPDHFARQLTETLVGRGYNPTEGVKLAVKARDLIANGYAQAVQKSPDLQPLSHEEAAMAGVLSELDGGGKGGFIETLLSGLAGAVRGGDSRPHTADFGGRR